MSKSIKIPDTLHRDLTALAAKDGRTVGKQAVVYLQAMATDSVIRAYGLRPVRKKVAR